MEVFILGCGGSMPLPYRHLTSVLLRREGDLFLFDCGEGTQVSLRRLNLRWKKISAIFISHTHADHVTGLPGMLMLSSQVERDDPLYIYGPPRIKSFVETMRDQLEMHINYEIVVREIPVDAGGLAVHQTADFTVRSFPLRHSRPCVGYAFEERPRPGVFFPEQAMSLGVPRGKLWSVLQGGAPVTIAGGTVIEPHQVVGPARSGRKVAFVTDTLAIPSIEAEVSDSDLLVCEGMFTDDLSSTAREKRHMTASQAATIARNARAKRLGLIHYSPRYTDRDLRDLLAEAQAVFPETVLTRDQQVFNIAYPSDS